MIESFRHKGLRLLYDEDNHKQVGAERGDRLRLILSALDAAGQLEDLNQATLERHPLTGDRAGEWAVKVNKNWRVTFRFADGRATDVDLVDYH